MVFWIVIGVIAVVLITIFIFQKKPKPVKKESYYIDALCALADNQLDKAIKLLRNTVYEDTDNVEAYIRLGELYRQKGDYERAIDIHRSLMARPTLSREKEIRVYHQLVKDYLADRRIEKAISLLKELIKIDKNNPAPVKLLMNLYLSNEAGKEALRFIKENPKLFKNKKLLSGYYTEIGNQMKEKERDEEAALECYKKAFKLQPENEHVLLALAKFYMDKNDLKNAYQYAKKIMEVPTPETGHFTEFLGKILFETGKYETIGSFYKKLLNKFPDDEEILLKLASFYMKRDEGKKAKKILEERYEKFPHSPLTILGIVKLYMKEGDINSAKEFIAKLEDSLERKSWRCENCGTRFDRFSWFCPSCGEYRSLKC